MDIKEWLFMHGISNLQIMFAIIGFIATVEFIFLYFLYRKRVKANREKYLSYERGIKR